MDRADVIIFGGGLVGLTLASALDSSGLSAILIDPADPERAQERGLRRPHQRSFVELDAHARDDRRRRSSCRSPAARSARSRSPTAFSPGGLAFEPEDDEPLGGHARKPALARRASQARAEAGRNLWLLWKSTPQIGRARNAWRDGGAGRRPEAVARRCWPPSTGAIRRRARRPESASRAGNTTIWRWSRRSGTSGRTTTSPTRSSSRPARSRCCR